MKTLLLSIRSLMRFRFYTCINILGLALSLACVIIICRYVHLENTIDNYGDRTERICMTVREDKVFANQNFVMGQWNPAEQPDFPNPLNDPSVACSSNFYWFNKDNIQANGKDYYAGVIVADSNFLKILDLPMLYGNSQSIAQNPQNIILTEPFARKIFGTVNVVGKELTYVTGHTLTVSGVIRSLPFKSSFHFDAVLSDKLQEVWQGALNQCLVLLHPNTDIKELNARHQNYVYVNMWQGEGRFQFKSMQDIYFTPHIQSFNDMLLKGDRKQLPVLLLVAVIILSVGLFNFINIYTVVQLRRGKEFGMKKVFGGSRLQLMAQLYTENFFMTSFALFIGWMLIELCGNAITEQLELQQLSNIRFDGLLTLTILFFLPLITIIIPFARYNKTTPVNSLREIGTNKSGTFSRSLFLSVQYVLTTVLIIVSLFLVKQLDFMLNADLGYRTDNIIRFNIERNDRKQMNSKEEFRAMLQKEEQGLAKVKAEMNASSLFDTWDFYTICPHEYGDNMLSFKNTETGILQNAVTVPGSPATFKILDIHLSEGRLWNDNLDNDNLTKLVLNESAMKLFGFKNIDQAWLEAAAPMQIGASNPRCQVVGVVKDFRSGHLSKATSPIIYYLNPGYVFSPVGAHILPEKKQEAISFLKNLHNEAFGGAFEYSFLTDEVNALYKNDRQLTRTFSVFAIIAIIISSLGLFSLSLFDVQQRFREIAIRKINGATTQAIMQMLLNKYYRLLCLAFIVAIPIAWLSIRIYLEGFANKTTISWWLLAIALLITGSVSILTLIWQIRKAAQMNPVNAIKNE